MLSFLLNSLLLSTLLAMVVPALSVGQVAVVLDDIAAGAASTGALADNSSADVAIAAARQRLGNHTADNRADIGADIGVEIAATQSGFGANCVIRVQIADSVPVAPLATSFDLIGEGQAVCENPDAFAN